MKVNKLYELLCTFSPTELRRLGQLVASPFFNQREDVARLFDYLVLHLDQESPPERQVAFVAVYPGEAFDDSKWRHLNSFLYKHCEQLLVEQELKKDILWRNTLLLRALKGRNTDKVLRNTLSAQNRLMDKSPIRNTDLHLHRIETLRTEMTSSEVRTEKLQSSFQELSQELDVFYVLHKLQLACAALTHQRMFKVEYELGMLEEVLAYIQKNDLLTIPEVAICYDCYMMLSEPMDESHFFRLKAKMALTKELFESTETRTFFTHLINFCISRINQGELPFLREVFEIYQLALPSGTFLTNGFLSPFTYKNIVSAAIKLGEFDWTEQFIDEYAPQLPPDARKEYHGYNLARLHLANGKYSAVVKILNGLYLQDPFAHLDGRIILIKAYYALGEFKQIEYLLENLKHHLRRKEFMTYHKKNYLAFTRFARRLVNLAPFDTKQHEKLRAEILEAEWLSERDWLIEQIDAL